MKTYLLWLKSPIGAAALLGIFSSAGCGGEDTIDLSTSSAGAGGSFAQASSTSVGGGCSQPAPDRDGDGFSPEMGDCNDCDPNSNPNAIEVPGSNADEDCDGTVDEDDELEACDSSLVTDSADPLDGARAMDLCKSSEGKSGWGIISAKWSQMDGSEPPTDGLQKQRFDVGHGMVPKFGALLKPQRGDRMLALSTGEARDLDDPQSTKRFGYSNPILFKFYECGPPDGFPKPVASCQDSDPPLSTGASMADSIALDLEIRTPSNAHGFSFEHNYMHGAWPLNCYEMNPFLALLDPMPKDQFDGNIVFDKNGEYVGQPATIRACGCADGPPCSVFDISKPPEQVPCPLGDAELLGTGFGRDGGDPGGGTGWQRTQAPIEPNTVIKLRITVAQGGELSAFNHDATVLIDNWRWLLEPGVDVGTAPK